MRSEESQSPENVPLQKIITQIALNQRPHTQMAITISSANLSWIGNSWAPKNSDLNFFFAGLMRYNLQCLLVIHWSSGTKNCSWGGGIACLHASAILRSWSKSSESAGWTSQGSDNVHPKWMNNVHSFWVVVVVNSEHKQMDSIAFFFNSNNWIP